MAIFPRVGPRRLRFVVKRIGQAGDNLVLHLKEIGERLVETLGPKMHARSASMSQGALDGKTKELIGLAVAAQIPCQYCVYAHTLGAKQAGATDEQIKEAIAASGLVR